MQRHTYRQTLDYLYERLPMFSKTGKDAIKHDLNNIRSLCTLLGQPQERFRSIHIAGTNGKGSVSHMLSAVHQEAGYKTGLYTSPHLVDFRERIRIGGTPVSEEWVIGFVDQHKDTIENIRPSFFEITLAMAFTAFAEAEVDIAVIETGLGGRLDSTNIITPVLSIITNISLDHTDLLGTTLREIAGEKAGIIKPRIPVLIGIRQEETAPVFFEKALQQQTSVYYAENIWELAGIRQEPGRRYYKAVHTGHRKIYDLDTDMTGNYQTENIRTVLAATELLNQRNDLPLPLPGVFSGLRQVRKTTGLRGRWDILQQEPLIIADVAHNAAGLEEVMKQWDTVEAATKHIMIGFVRDKDFHASLKCFPRDAVYYFTQAGIPRALPAAELKAAAEALSLNGNAYPDVATAIQAATASMKENDALLITGSFFSTGEAMEALKTPNHISPDF